MRKIDYIVVHCSDSPDGRDDGFTQINQWHKQRGFKSPRGIFCGYHYVIRRKGIIEVGRTVDETGAHVEGHNFNSIGICLVGTKEFDFLQISSLRRLIDGLLIEFPGALVKPHCWFDTAKAQGKTCPNIDIEKALKNG